MNQWTVLVVDDDKEIVESVAIFLRNEGLHVMKAYDGMDALEKISENTIHLILMDIMMPKLDGMKAMMRIREQKNIPIILVSAKTEDTDKIIGLNMGADDYITKPYNPLELVARVKSQLRRYTNFGQMPTQAPVVQLNVGGIIMDLETKQVWVEGEEVKLTPIEYRILELLMRNPNRVFSIQEIYERVWEEPYYNADNIVAVHIRRIREKIEINPKEPRYLKVVWGIGYKIQSE
ncbi:MULTISPECIES: response regulator transcription factor [Clostridiaceae]|uniref:Stage 0 sporulation protein A homolog n=1 Tax=Clostridium facile TaxID=2763035 RepID=A0ABR7IN06_9CLOT|nr:MULTISPECIES: response regulator transcription factor [Clostridiaceae]MBC5786502.1 response regulator transcription factor [Clostridium facile]PWM99071.1 MAG: DNA-binding response regulator [Massilioclostridium sp.]